MLGIWLLELDPTAAEGVHWIRKAAEQECREAETYLGTLYACATGVSLDMEQALVWFRKGAEKGDANAQMGLSFAYMNGDGVEQDDRLADHQFVHFLYLVHTDVPEHCRF